MSDLEYQKVKTHIVNALEVFYITKLRIASRSHICTFGRDVKTIDTLTCIKDISYYTDENKTWNLRFSDAMSKVGVDTAVPARKTNKVIKMFRFILRSLIEDRQALSLYTSWGQNKRSMV